MQQIRAVVIDEVPLVRAGISAVLREQRLVVVAEQGSAADASGVLRGTDAHLLVLGDIGDGGALVAVIQRVKERGSDVKVVVLVPPGGRDELLAIIDSGADAVVPHDVDRAQLGLAVAAVQRGERHLSSELTATLFSSAPADEPVQRLHAPHVLTPREQGIVRLLAQGLTNDDIAHHLFISPATVKTHLSNVYAKLEAKNRFEAVVKATQAGLI